MGELLYSDIRLNKCYYYQDLYYRALHLLLRLRQASQHPKQRSTRHTCFQT